MSSIQNQSMAGTMLPGRSAMFDPRFSGQVKEQSFSFYESLEAGLTIETKEGDMVTISSEQYTGMDAYSYDSSGLLQTGEGSASVSRNVREITLATGENFTFTVSGDLSEEELQDIEAIVLGIDEIISEVAVGDMDDAVAKALAMGDYDTVSMYSADISYQKAYTARSTYQSLEGQDASGYESFPGRGHHRGRGGDQLPGRMMEKLERYDANQLEKAQKPLDKLFKHYLDREQDDTEEKTPRYQWLWQEQNKISEWIRQRTRDMFKDGFSDTVEESSESAV